MLRSRRKRSSVFDRERFVRVSIFLSLYKREIQYIFDTVNNISLEQRIKLLYQRVRIYIHTDDYEKIPALRSKIQKLDPISKYCYEVDYWLACKNNDLTGVNKAIQALKDLGFIIMPRVITKYHSWHYEFQFL